MSYTTLISTDELAAHLRGARPTEGVWRIVDCRFDLQNDAWGREQYEAAHIPGAVYADLNRDLSTAKTGANGRHPLPSVEALASLFGRLGIDRDTQVVVYDQDAGPYAARLWWSLRYLGHDQVALLDGGWAKWTKEGRATHAGGETVPTAVFTPAVRAGSLVTLDAMATLVAGGKTLIVDARPPERFEGREEKIDRVAGHIPGAVNHFFRENLAADGTMLSEEQLRARFEALLAGRTAAQTVMYCGSGVTACHNLLAMEHAGWSGAPLYVGSWSEWSADPSRGVETGPARRT